MAETPDYILCMQHGWADTEMAMAKLAHYLATPNAIIISPSLGWWKTWVRIHPLIDALEAHITDAIKEYPETPLRIVAHSMGGLIWLELLHRNHELRSRVDSFVLIASPVGGASLARIVDPFSWGLGIARDLGQSRRTIAEDIAQEIPTLVVTGDKNRRGTDGVVAVQSTRFAGAKFVCLPEIDHVAIRTHPSVVGVIKDFWEDPVFTPVEELSFVYLLIKRLQEIPGMTDESPRHLESAKPYLTFKNGMTISIWKSWRPLEYVFLSSPEGESLYSGYVGWFNRVDLHRELNAIAKEYETI